MKIVSQGEMLSIMLLFLGILNAEAFLIPQSSYHKSAGQRSISTSSLQQYHTILKASSDSIEQPIAPLINSSPKQKKKKLQTFARYLEIESWKRGPSARDLEMVLRSIGEACKQINRIVQRAQTDDLYGDAVGSDGEQLDANIQGEVQQKLDVVCNAILLKQFCGSSKGVIAAVASEEEDEPRSCRDVMVSVQISKQK